MKEVSVLRDTRGVHSGVDPRKLSYTVNGFKYLEAFINMDVLDDGAVQTREGYTVTDVDGSYHSLYFWQGTIYGVCDSSLFSIDRGGTKTTIRSAMIVSKIYYQGVGEYIFYSNGIQNGYIIEGVNHAWAPDDYVGPDTVREIQAVLPGKYLSLFKGAIYFAVGTHLYHTEPLHYTGINLSSNYISFEDEIRMVLSLDDILIVGTVKDIFVLQGDSPKDFVLKSILNSNIIADTGVVAVSPVVMSEQLTGKIGIFTTHDGIYAVAPDGQLMELTENRLHFQSSLSGAAYMKDNFYTVFIDE